jgi:hypothetical protein
VCAHDAGTVLRYRFTLLDQRCGDVLQTAGQRDGQLIAGGRRHDRVRSWLDGKLWQRRAAEIERARALL